MADLLRRPLRCLSLSLLCAPIIAAAPVHADEAIIGQASVIDGDTIEIRGQRIRLHGIDAPEGAQLCVANGKNYRCGQEAALALSDKIGGDTVSCRERDRDRYGRVVAVCSSRGVDLNGWLVAQGHAVAYRRYSTDYIDAEAEARTAKRGVWQGEFDLPWAWRQGKRVVHAQPTTSTTSTTGCRIKGNISRSGTKTYHAPGMRHYEITRINISKGERWFCSEAEAAAAGWKRAPE